MKQSLWVLAIMALFLGGVGQAQAGLMGDSIDAQYLYPTQTPVYQDLGTNAVNPTAHFNSFAQINYDVSDTTIVITLDPSRNGTPVTFTPATFNGVSFTDVTQNPNILGVTIDGSTNLSGFTLSDVSFTSNQVFVNLQGLTFGPSTVVQLDLQFQQEQPPPPRVPEPTSLVLFGMTTLAAGGYCGWRRRRTVPV